MERFWKGYNILDVVYSISQASFYEVGEDNVDELLESHDAPLTNEDLMGMQEQTR